MMNNRKLKIIIGCFLFLFIMLLSSCNNDILKEFSAQLELPSETTNDLELKSEYEFKGKTINVSWYSSNENAISNNGIVNYTEYDIIVDLIATMSYGENEMKKTFKVKVLGQNDDEVLEKAANSIIFPISISSDIKLPLSKTIDNKVVNIKWESSDESIVKKDGKVILPLVDTNVLLTGVFTLNKTVYKKGYSILVIKDPMYNPENSWHLAQVYFGEIENESYPERQKEFPGAVYHKVISSRDWWQGIETVVTLPEFTGDEKRTGQHPQGSLGDMRFLDNGSVYLGANCLKESDVGLTWSIGAKDATVTEVNYSESIAYRPFWRYITSDNKNLYANSKWQDTQFYYYPGDKIRMSVFSPENGKLQLRIELLEETTIPKYVERRASYNLGPNYEKVFVSSTFESPGVGIYKTIFKRVVAIDQVNNEAKPTCPTNASNIGAIYHECYLYRTINGKVYKVPMIEKRMSSINSPSSTNSLGDFTNAITVTYDGVDKNLGGEVVSIDPKNNKQ